MSLAERAVTAPAIPARREERRLRAVESPAPRRRPRMLYAIIAVAGAVAIAVAQLALSILTTEDSYRVADLMQERRDLTLQAQQLEDSISGLSSPQYLAANAAALGMVIDSSPTFLRLSDGKTLGSGGASTWTSTVDVAHAEVGNALISDTPLVTDPDRTVAGTQGKEEKAAEAEPETPPSIDDGLPSPQTH